MGASHGVPLGRVVDGRVADKDRPAVLQREGELAVDAVGFAFPVRVAKGSGFELGCEAGRGEDRYGCGGDGGLYG